MTLAGWASVPLFLKHFTGVMDAWASNGWRYAFSALLWLPVLLLRARRGHVPRRLWRAAIVPSLFNTFGQVAFAWAPYFIDPGLMTFGLRTQIVFVALGAYIFFHSERPILRSPVFLAALAIVFVGAMGTLILGHAPDLAPAARSIPTILGYALSASQARAVGIALSIVSGALFAGYGLSVRHFLHGMHPVTAFAAICQYTGAGMVVLLLLFARDIRPAGSGNWDAGLSVLALPAGQLALLALSSVVGIALGHVFYYASIARLGVAVSSGVIQLQPVLVAIGSYFLFRELLTPLQWACGVAAIAGALVMLTEQQRLARARRRTALAQ